MYAGCVCWKKLSKVNVRMERKRRRRNANRGYPLFDETDNDVENSKPCARHERKNQVGFAEKARWTLYLKKVVTEIAGESGLGGESL